MWLGAHFSWHLTSGSPPQAVIPRKFREVGKVPKVRVAAPDCARQINPQQLTNLLQRENGKDVPQAAVSSYPIPGKSEAQQQDAAPDLAQLVDSGAVSKGMPRKGGSRREAPAGRA
jgi:hypothetical protein